MQAGVKRKSDAQIAQVAQEVDELSQFFWWLKPHGNDLRFLLRLMVRSLWALYGSLQGLHGITICNVGTNSTCAVAAAE